MTQKRTTAKLPNYDGIVVHMFGNRFAVKTSTGYEHIIGDAITALDRKATALVHAYTDWLIFDFDETVSPSDIFYQQSPDRKFPLLTDDFPPDFVECFGNMFQYSPYEIVLVDYYCSIIGRGARSFVHKSKLNLTDDGKVFGIDGIAKYDPPEPKNPLVIADAFSRATGMATRIIAVLGDEDAAAFGEDATEPSLECTGIGPDMTKGKEVTFTRGNGSEVVVFVTWKEIGAAPSQSAQVAAENKLRAEMKKGGLV